MLSTVFTSSYSSSGTFWFLGKTKRKSNLEAEKIPVIGELAYFSHELAYEKQSEIVEWKNGDNLL